MDFTSSDNSQILKEFEDEFSLEVPEEEGNATGKKFNSDGQLKELDKEDNEKIIIQRVNNAVKHALTNLVKIFDSLIEKKMIFQIQ